MWGLPFEEFPKFLPPGKDSKINQGSNHFSLKAYFVIFILLIYLTMQIETKPKEPFVFKNQMLGTEGSDKNESIAPRNDSHGQNKSTKNADETVGSPLKEKAGEGIKEEKREGEKTGMEENNQMETFKAKKTNEIPQREASGSGEMVLENPLVELGDEKRLGEMEGVIEETRDPMDSFSTNCDENKRSKRVWSSKGLQEFWEDYEKKAKRVGLREEALVVAEQNMEFLYELAKTIEKLGGFEEVYICNYWGKAQEFLAEPPAQLTSLTKNKENNPIQGITNRFLFHYFFYDVQGHNVLKMSPDDLSYPVIHNDWPDDPEERTQWCRGVLSEQCCLLKGFEQKLHLKSELFQFDAILKAHGKDMIDVVEQNPKANSMEVKKKEQQNIKTQMSISEYIKYVDKMKGIDHSNISATKIKFGVNVDAAQWDEIVEELERAIPPEFLMKSEVSSLSYFRQDIEGISLPQFYLKVAGSWTGGHEENLRLRAININHGPGDCEWYCMANTEVPTFRKHCIDNFDCDIHKWEGLWFTDIFNCMVSKAKVMKFVQKPGDIVTIGPGCLHWVRSRAATVNSAWNTASNDWYQFRQIFERARINKEVGYPILIPYKTLTMDSVNLVGSQFPEGDLEKMVVKLREFVNDSKVLQAKLEQKGFKVKRDWNSINNVLMCSLCREDTMCFWGVCESCFQAKSPCLFCADCAMTHEENCKKKKPALSVYQKYLIEDIEKLIERRLNKDLGIMKELTAPWHYVGKAFKNVECASDPMEPEPEPEGMEESEEESEEEEEKNEEGKEEESKGRSDDKPQAKEIRKSEFKMRKEKRREASKKQESTLKKPMKKKIKEVNTPGHRHFHPLKSLVPSKVVEYAINLSEGTKKLLALPIKMFEEIYEELKANKDEEGIRIIPSSSENKENIPNITVEDLNEFLFFYSFKMRFVRRFIPEILEELDGCDWTDKERLKRQVDQQLNELLEKFSHSGKPLTFDKNSPDYSEERELRVVALVFVLMVLSNEDKPGRVIPHYSSTDSFFLISTIIFMSDFLLICEEWWIYSELSFHSSLDGFEECCRFSIPR